MLGKHKISSSSDNTDDDNSDIAESSDLFPKEELPILTETALNNKQTSLMTKGKKLREILLNQSSDDGTVLLGSKIIDTLLEISTAPIEILDENSAKERIQQWKNHEFLCEKFKLTAESYNLIHLVSLVKVYEDLMRIGENIVVENQSVKSWVTKFMRKTLGINRKEEYRNRLGCDRLRSLFKLGITSEHLVRAGCHKYDFLARKEDYAFFLSQIPPMVDGLVSVLPSNIIPNLDLNLSANNSKRLCKDQDTRKVMFKLRLNDDDLHKEIVNEEDRIYIE